MRTKDPWSSLSRPSSVIYIYTAFRCNPVNVKIPRVPPRSICLHSNYHRPLPPSLAFFFVFLTRNQPPPSSKLSEETDRYLKARAFLFFFSSICLPSLHFYIGGERWLRNRSLGENSNSHSFIPLLTRLASDASVGTHSPSPPPRIERLFQSCRGFINECEIRFGRFGPSTKGRGKNRSVGNRGQWNVWPVFTLEPGGTILPGKQIETWAN